MKRLFFIMIIPTFLLELISCVENDLLEEVYVVDNYIGKIKKSNDTIIVSIVNNVIQYDVEDTDFDDGFGLILSNLNNLPVATSFTYIRHKIGASSGFDEFDVPLLSLSNDFPYSYIFAPPPLYSVNCYIQYRYPFILDDKYIIGVKISQPGQYKFSVNYPNVPKYGVFDNGQPIYLLDNQTGLTTNLQDFDYYFSTNTAINSIDRFIISYFN